MTKKKITFWACDYSSTTGEGNLARNFVKQNFKKFNVSVHTPKTNNFFNHKYIIPFIGVGNCWKYYLKGQIIGYINYLPLWNFLIFFLLPPKTIFGPITGGAFYNNNNILNFFIRKFIFPFFYKISEIILNIRFKDKILFSTELLKKNLSKKTIKKSKFNFVVENFKFKKKKNKSIDFLIYYREHGNKQSFFNYQFLKMIINKKLKVYVVGDMLKINGVNNLGYISKNRISNLQSKSKYSICSGENIYSLFLLECISNHVKILTDKKYLKHIKFFKKFFININNFKFKN